MRSQNEPFLIWSGGESGFSTVSVMHFMLRGSYPILSIWFMRPYMTMPHGWSCFHWSSYVSMPETALFRSGRDLPSSYSCGSFFRYVLSSSSVYGRRIHPFLPRFVYQCFLSLWRTDTGYLRSLLRLNFSYSVCPPCERIPALSGEAPYSP